MRFTILRFLLIGAVLLAASTANAAVYYWYGNDGTSGGNGTWSTVAGTDGYWGSSATSGTTTNLWVNAATPNVPHFATSGGNVVLGSDVTVGTVWFDVGGYSITGDRTLTMKSGNGFYVTGTATISTNFAAQLTSTTNNWISKWWSGYLLFNGDVTRTFASGTNLSAEAGTWELASGTTTAVPGGSFGIMSSAAATLLVSGGVVDNGTGDFKLYNSGIYRQTAGNVSVGNTYVTGSGLAANKTALLSLEGGTMTVGSFVTLGGTAVATHTYASGGTLTVSGAAQLTTPYISFFNKNVTGTSLAILNLNGGNVTAGSITVGYSTAGTSTVNFNGGTLTAKADASDFISTSVNNAYVLAGGAKINTNGYAVTIQKALTTGVANDGGLTKLGAGTLTLAAANTYVGATNVSAGLLNVTGSIGNGGIYVASAGNSTGSFDGTQATYQQAFGGAFSLKTSITSGLLTSGTVAGSSAATPALSWRTRSTPESGMLISDVANIAGLSSSYSLTMDYSEAALAAIDPTMTDVQADAAGLIYIAYWDGAGWAKLGGAVDTGANMVTATVSGAALSATQFAVVPEPGTLALLAGALVGLIAYAWRKRK